jgi:RNA polymerase sigma-70 factor (ECF subfamily)
VSEPQAEPSCAEEPQTDVARSEFDALYVEHSRAVYYLALRMLGNEQKAEDATHDVFVKAYRNLQKFRGESSWRTWLYRIAINHCRNLQQTWHERHILAQVEDTLIERAGGDTESPLRVLETRELGDRIQQTLDALPPEYRLLLLLVADEQMTYDEVGALTGQSADAVRGKLHRARKAFAAIFKQSE